MANLMIFSPAGEKLPDLLKLSAPPQRTQGAQGQKAFWNKNGSITVMEVFNSDSVKVKNTKKISLPETLEKEDSPPRPTVTRMRKLSDSIVESKIKPKILFAPSTHFGERRRRRERKEEKGSLIMRNYQCQGRKVVNLGDMELTQPLEPLPDLEWFVEVKANPGSSNLNHSATRSSCSEVRGLASRPSAQNLGLLPTAET